MQENIIIIKSIRQKSNHFHESFFSWQKYGCLICYREPKIREPFEPLIGGTAFADFNNLDSIKEKITDKTCAILVEPVQGEGGVYHAEKQFLIGLRNLCDELDILLIFDEIQCGMGRTGSMFAYQGYGVKPDIITSAKALGCGVPVGAFAATDKVAAAFEPGRSWNNLWRQSICNGSR